MDSKHGVYVWDRFVRVFHWSLVVFFSIAYISGEGSEIVHAYSGYVVLCLIVSRIIWGLIGSQYARFSSFIFPPSEYIRYWRSLLQRKPIYYLGHNPAGGIMVILLLCSIFLSCWTGLVVYGKQGHGPLAQQFQWQQVLAQVDISPLRNSMANDDDDDAGQKNQDEELWEEIHEICSNFSLFLIVLHIAGVVISSYLHQENLLRAMMTGYKIPGDKH